MKTLFNSLPSAKFCMLFSHRLFHTIRVLKSLDPDQARHFDLDPDCLQKFSADDTRRQSLTNKCSYLMGVRTVRLGQSLHLCLYFACSGSEGKGLQVQASPEALHYVLEHDTLSSA